MTMGSIRKKYQYRLSQIKKQEVAQNLIDIIDMNAEIKKETKRFVCDWILTGPEEKRKVFYDVWDIVLRNYIPQLRPILFRSCIRRGKKESIASFSGRLECARRFSEGKGLLLMCDTKETLKYEQRLYQKGQYKHSFFPLVEVLIKARNSGGSGFSERFLNEYIGEDEYIMRVSLDNMHIFKWK